METIIFDGSKIALIVRGKVGIGHEPDLLAQHADAVLPDGSPVGFFGEGRGTSGSGAKIGFGMDGVVYEYAQYKVHRPYYVDLDQAKRYKMKSTVLVLTVNENEAILFKNFWVNLKTTPGGFWLIGDNCSTHASDAFIKTGIVNKGIPGLDTPNNLYRQLVAIRKKAKSYSGYIGFQKKTTGDGFDLVVDN